MSAYPSVAATCDQPGCTASITDMSDAGTLLDAGWWIGPGDITHSHHPTAYCPDHAPDEEDLP